MRTPIASVLDDKGHDVWSVSPSATVAEAIQTMTEKRCQALLVLHEERVVGILSERDCGRRVVLPGRDTAAVRVEEVMTSPVEYVSPDHTVGDCIWIMTEKRIGHLPVLEGDKLVGVVSTDDLLRSVVKTQGALISHLEGYISGKYPG
ncbi:MAG: CBS domain-containing protein [Candidatus Binatia bacterium]